MTNHLRTAAIDAATNALADVTSAGENERRLVATTALDAADAVIGELAAARLLDLEQDNEGLSRHGQFMERYRMRATVLEAAARRLLTAWDAHVDSLMVCGDDDPAAASDRLARTLVDRETAVEALRGLVDGQPESEADDG